MQLDKEALLRTLDYQIYEYHYDEEVIVFCRKDNGKYIEHFLVSEEKLKISKSFIKSLFNRTKAYETDLRTLRKILIADIYEGADI